MDYEGNIVFEAEVDFVNKVINGISYGEIYNGSKYEIVCIDNKGNIIANYTELGYTDVNEWYGEINVLSSNEHEYLVGKMGNKIEDLNEVIVQFYGDFIILSKSDNTNTKVYSQKGKLLLELDDRYYINNTDLYGDDYEENILFFGLLPYRRYARLLRWRCKEIERYGGSCSSYYYCGVLFQVSESA